MNDDDFSRFSMIWVVVMFVTTLPVLVLPHLNLSWKTKARANLIYGWLLGTFTAGYGVVVMRVDALVYHHANYSFSASVFWIV